MPKKLVSAYTIINEVKSFDIII